MLSLGVTVGVPKALLYYFYYPMLQEFFTQLGVQVVTSGPSTKEILDNGVKEALAEACVPIKLYFGHVLALKNKADYIFTPRVVCLNKRTIYCPKFLGLPDMIRYSLDDLPPIIDTWFDARKGLFPLYKSFEEVGMRFTNSRRRIFKAYYRALVKNKQYRQTLEGGCLPEEAMSLLINPNISLNPQTGDLQFAVLGYPYHIYDSFINVNLLNKLKKLGVKIITAENLPQKELNKQGYGLKKSMFWTFSDRALKAAHYIFTKGLVDGIIYITAFGCGPDAMVYKLIELESKKYPHIPFMTLMIDEQSGEAGIATRLEAFVDMVRRRRGVSQCLC